VQRFTVEANKLKLLKRLELDHERVYHTPALTNLHLRHNKLWFNKPSGYLTMGSHKSPRPRPNPPIHMRISYFDLNEEYPKEITVGKFVKVDGNATFFSVQ
jgi:hypothetical protein